MTRDIAAVIIATVIIAIIAVCAVLGITGMLQAEFIAAAIIAIAIIVIVVLFLPELRAACGPLFGPPFTYRRRRSRRDTDVVYLIRKDAELVYHSALGGFVPYDADAPAYPGYAYGGTTFTDKRAAESIAARYGANVVAPYLAMPPLPKSTV